MKNAKLYNNIIIGRISFGSERHYWQSGCLQIWSYTVSVLDRCVFLILDLRMLALRLSPSQLIHAYEITRNKYNLTCIWEKILILPHSMLLLLPKYCNVVPMLWTCAFLKSKLLAPVLLSESLYAGCTWTL